MKRSIIIQLLLMCICVSNAQISNTIKISESNIIFEKNEKYDIISFKFDNYYTLEVGTPQLPVIIKSFIIPLNANIETLKIETCSKYKLSGEFKILPVQEPCKVKTSMPSIIDFNYNDSIYNSNEPFPYEKIKIISDLYEHGHHIITIEICPFEYIPLKKELYYCNFSYSINYTLNQKNKYSSTFKSLKRYKLANAYISSKVENHNDIARFSKTNNNILREGNQTFNIINELIPEYFIITNNELKPIFQKLADWKTQKGLPTIIKTVEDIEVNYRGSDTAEKIRNYLKESQCKWGDDFFVLLGGDTNIIPERMATNGPDREDKYKKETDTYIKDSILAPQDLYYTALEGTWNQNRNGVYNEYYQYLTKDKKVSNLIDIDKSSFGRNLYLGRAPVNDSIEALIFVNKVITYEKANADINYSYINNYLAADAFISYENGILSLDARQYIDSYLKKYSTLNYWLQYDHFNCNCNKHSRYLTQSPGEELNKVNFLAALQNGGNSGLNHFHIIYHMDHSSPRNLGSSSKDKNELINNDDVDILENGFYYQIILSGGCEPATFSKDCIAEHFLGNPNGGAVAFIGNADRGWSSEHFQFENFLKTLYETNGNYYNLAYIFQKTIGQRNSNNCRLTLLGDPEMPIWTATPQNLNVSTSTSQTTENSTTVNTITVKINNLPAGQEALVCLMKGTEYYITDAITDTNPHSFSYVPKSSGEIKVTVTAHNFRPFETTVPINAGSYPHITMKPTMRDSGTNCIGNGDGQLDAGETIEVTANLHSAVIRNLTNVRFELKCSSQEISMLDSTVTFNTISLSPTATQTAAFRFKIKNSCPEMLKNELNPVRFELYMLSDNNTEQYQDEFTVDIFTPDIEVGNQNIVSTSNGNTIIEANETVAFTVNLRNIGKAEAVGLVGILRTTCPYISSYTRAPFVFPNIPKYEIKKNSDVFQFRTTANYISGTSLPFSLEVRNRYGKIWILDIDPANRPARIAQSDITFKGYENSIDLTWSVNATLSYNVFRSNSETGEYVQLNKFPLTSSYFKDDNVALNTVYYYKVAAINKSGNESALSNPIKGWTTLPVVEGFPVTMSDTPRDFWTRSGVTAYDVNNDGKQEIFATQVAWNPYKGRIIGLNSTGEDLFDIDGNVTTKSGFALWNNDIRSVPTLADLKSDGEVEVIVASREGTNNYIRCYSVKDENNDHMPDVLWEKPTSASYARNAIVANMDNSSDGSQEIVLAACEGRGQISILDYNGNELYTFGNNITAYSAPAVADLDGDGDMEIIAGNSDGVYIWHHDGTPFSTNPIYSESGYHLGSSPVICDIDNDGKKEILIVAKKIIGSNNALTECFVLAIHPDGTLVQGWNKTQKTSFTHYNYSHDISVGDLTGDGKLEVVALGSNNLKVWNNKGIILLDKNVNASNEGGMVSILADVDGDGLSEIIFANEQGAVPTIYAINPDGTDVAGFPLATDYGFWGSVCVADIDNDGKNELVAMTDKVIYAWKTEGKSNCIEWGLGRHDHLNTGEYGKTCQPEVILSNTIWNGESPCQSIFIQSGNLTIPSGTTMNLNGSSRIVVRSEGTLTIDGATINNAYILAQSGSKVIIKNGGIINLRNSSNFVIEKGATLDYQQGNITPSL